MSDADNLFSFVLGQVGAMPATVKSLFYLSEIVPPVEVRSVLGLGSEP